MLLVRISVYANYVYTPIYIHIYIYIYMCVYILELVVHQYIWH